MRYKYFISLVVLSFCLSVAKAQDHETIDSLLNLSDSLITREPDKSLEYAKQAFQSSEQIHYEKGKLLAMIYLADIYWGKTELKKALNFAEEAKSLATELTSQIEYAEALIIIGKVYTVLGEFDKSSDFLFEALKIVEHENYKIGTGKALNRIGFLYFDLGSYEKALDYYSQSLALSREMSDSIGIARGLNNIAASYASMGVFTDFEISIKEAIRVNKQNDNKSWLGVNYLNLGSANAENNNYDSAFYYYELAISIFEELNQLEKLAKVYIELSDSYKIYEDNRNRLLYAKMAYSLARDNNLSRMQYIASQKLHNYYIDLKDTVNAYVYNIIETQTKDSLEIAKNNTRLTHLEILYEIEKKEHEIKLQNQRRNFITQIIILSLVAGLVLILLILLRYRLKVKYTQLRQEKLADELDFKKREMTTNALSLMKKNEALTEIADKLKDIRNDAVKDETKLAIKKIAGELEQNTESEIWNDFEKRFNQVHQDFYIKLHHEFPDLSPHEQRLCAFLKLNMSSKDIAELTGQKVESLEKARTRLRKKLGLTNTNTNLVTFLSQF